jgi:FixJ family two-component response regulator
MTEGSAHVARRIDSPRQQQVMARVVSAVLNRQVGDDRRISAITVNPHRSTLMRTMGATPSRPGHDRGDAGGATTST